MSASPASTDAEAAQRHKDVVLALSTLDRRAVGVAADILVQAGVSPLAPLHAARPLEDLAPC
jgi:hypothetical protein